MKISGDLFIDTGLMDWLEQDKWRGTLAVSATCGCDVARLGRDVRDYLNEKETAGSGSFVVFDREDIRRLAGDPSLRHRILSAVADPSALGQPGCDYECMIRSVASLGGAILAGQCCLEATSGLRNVFRVMVSSCGLCRTEDPSMQFDPARFSHESLVEVIADSFVTWSRDLYGLDLIKPAERKDNAATTQGSAITVV
jgi:hypothetical protein